MQSSFTIGHEHLMSCMHPNAGSSCMAELNSKGQMDFARLRESSSSLALGRLHHLWASRATAKKEACGGLKLSVSPCSHTTCSRAHGNQTKKGDRLCIDGLA